MLIPCTGTVHDSVLWMLHVDVQKVVHVQDIRSAGHLLQQAQAARLPPAAIPGEDLRYVLLVVDGTWRQAKEMYKASILKTPSFQALRMRLLSPLIPWRQTLLAYITLSFSPLSQPFPLDCQGLAWPNSCLRG